MKKSSCLISISTGMLVLGVGFIFGGEMGSDNDPTVLAGIAARAETAWPADIDIYCTRYDDLINLIGEGAKPKLSPTVVDSLLTPLLKKRDPALSQESLVLIKTQRRGMNALLSAASANTVSAENRLEVADICVMFLTELREQMSTIKDLPVSLNIAPPTTPKGSGALIYSGMDPNDIKDPVAHAAYIKAINENRNNNLINMQHHSIMSALSGGCWNVSFFLKTINATDLKENERIKALAAELQFIQNGANVPETK